MGGYVSDRICPILISAGAMAHPGKWECDEKYYGGVWFKN
jgi:hypothetical protein